MSELACLLDELVKLGAVSDEHAQAAIDRLQHLEKKLPTAGQLGRYSAVGAIAAPAIGAIGNVVRGRSPFEGKTGLLKLRDAASMATRGGLAASVIPVARAQSDRRAEIGTLKKYVAEREPKLAAAEEPDRDMREARIGGIGALGSIGATAGLGHLAMSHAGAEYAGKKELYEKLKAKARVPVHEIPGSGGGFSLDKPAVHIGRERSPGVLAHELGHAGIARHPVGKILQNKFTASLARSSPLIGMGTGFGAGASDDPTMRTLGVAAPAIAAAPELAYEAGASISGLRRLRRAGATKAQMRNAMKTLAPAWGTYAGRAGLGVLGAYGVRGAVTHARKKHELEEKEAELQKTAIMERLMNFAMKDIPHTPQLFARAAPAALNAGSGVKPLVNAAERGAQRYKDWQKAQSGVMKVAPRVSGVMRAAPAASGTFRKQGEGAPTRGNFMMASDMPGFRAPSLRTGIQKDADLLPEGVTYNLGDFKPVNIMKKRAVALTPAGRLAHSRGVGALRMDAPGSSIAGIAKPKGPGFGSGISGAFKTRIGVTAGTGAR